MAHIKNHPLYDNKKSKTLHEVAKYLSEGPVCGAPKTHREKIFKTFSRLFLANYNTNYYMRFNTSSAELARALEASYIAGLNFGQNNSSVHQIKTSEQPKIELDT